MSIFEVEKKNPVDLGMWASVYIKWNDDRGRAFDDVISFIEDEDSAFAYLEKIAAEREEE